MEKQKIEDIKNEYLEFIKTNKGKKWQEQWHNMKSNGDFTDYLYDFYPDVLREKLFGKKTDTGDIIQKAKENIAEYSRLFEEMDVLRKERQKLAEQLMPDDFNNLTYEDCKEIYDNFKSDIGYMEKIEIKAIISNKKLLKYPELSKPTYYPEINNLNVSDNEKLRLDKLARVSYRKRIYDWSMSQNKMSEKDIEIFVSLGIAEKRHLFYCPNCGDAALELTEDKFAKYKRTWELKEKIKTSSNEKEIQDILDEFNDLIDAGYETITIECMDCDNYYEINSMDDLNELSSDKPVYCFFKEPDLTYERL